MNSASDAVRNAADGLGNLDMVYSSGGLEFVARPSGIPEPA
jgi:hypothetical protein